MYCRFWCIPVSTCNTYRYVQVLLGIGPVDVSSTEASGEDADVVGGVEASRQHSQADVRLVLAYVQPLPLPSTASSTTLGSIASRASAEGFAQSCRSSLS